MLGIMFFLFSNLYYSNLKEVWSPKAPEILNFDLHACEYLPNITPNCC